MMAGGGRSWIPYCGAAPSPSEWLARWNFDPLVLVGIAGLSVLLWRLAPGRSRRAWGAGASGLLLLLFVSPLCALSSALFAARVGHHVLLTAVIAPMLVIALPRERLRLPGSLGFWTGAHALIFWLWHSPSLYAAAMEEHSVYWLMQASLLLSAVAFWAVLRNARRPAAVAALLAGTVQMGLLGALITFAGAPLYAPHLASTVAWGFSPLEDQQLAGLIMWIPSAGLYLGAALFIAHRWLAAESRAAAL